MYSLCAWQLKEKERRLRVRAEKMEEQRVYQEMRLRRMQERAHAGPSKKVRCYTITIPAITIVYYTDENNTIMKAL